LSASLTSPEKRRMRRTSLIYLCITLFSGLFSAVYEHFSYGVYSNYMVYLFLLPLVGGVLPYAVLGLTPRSPVPSCASSRLFNSGVAALTVGSCLKGVLQIYGTSSVYLAAYWAAGILLSVSGLAVFLLGQRRRRADA